MFSIVKFKKVICFTLVVASVLSMAACGATSDDNAYGETKAGETAANYSDDTESTTIPTGTVLPTGAEQTATSAETNSVTAPMETEHMHNYISSIVSPTCTEKGYTVFACVCGEKYSGEYMQAVGHSWNAWVTTKNASVSFEGEEQRVCSSCKRVETRKTDKATESNVTTQEPEYTVFQSALNTYTVQNKPYIDGKGDTEQAAWIGIYTIGMSADTETAIVSEFEKQYGFTPTGKVVCEKAGIYQVDGYKDAQTIYHYTITDKTYIYITNEMYKVYTQQCDDGSPWCGYCVFGTMDDLTEQMSTDQVRALHDEMFMKFATMTGYDMEYMEMHRDKYALGYVSEAGTVRTANGLAKVLYIYCRVYADK